MAEISWRRVLVGLLLLVFIFLLYQRVTDEEFLIKIGLFGGTREQVQMWMLLLNPIIMIGLLTGVLFFIFGASFMTAFMVAILGFTMYFTFTTPVFFSILGLTYGEQAEAIGWLQYMHPVIVSGIILAAAVILIQVRGD